MNRTSDSRAALAVASAVTLLPGAVVSDASHARLGEVVGNADSSLVPDAISATVAD
jgi:hypothetical protein